MRQCRGLFKRLSNSVFVSVLLLLDDGFNVMCETIERSAKRSPEWVCDTDGIGLRQVRLFSSVLGFGSGNCSLLSVFVLERFSFPIKALPRVNHRAVRETQCERSACF